MWKVNLYNFMEFIKDWLPMTVYKCIFQLVLYYLKTVLVNELGAFEEVI